MIKSFAVSILVRMPTDPYRRQARVITHFLFIYVTTIEYNHQHIKNKSAKAKYLLIPEHRDEDTILLASLIMTKLEKGYFLKCNKYETLESFQDLDYAFLAVTTINC
jgi:hypothetical protein